MNEKGITLVALVITIIILIIIAGISIKSAVKDSAGAGESIKITELQIVSNALVQTNTKLKIAKEKPGSKYGDAIELYMYDEINNILKPDEIKLKGEAKDYIIMLPDGGLKTIGIDNAKDTYIVNFKTGEVFNYTNPRTESGTLLYMEAYGK